MGLKTVLNLDADTGANVIGNETTPVLEISNSSTGPALKVDNIVATSGATIASLSTAGGALVAESLDVNGAILAANATVTAIDIRGASVASGASMGFSCDALKSVTTILATTGGAAGTQAIRIVKADGTFGWIPVYPDAAVTGTAVGA
jgi:hypothetical protein